MNRKLVMKIPLDKKFYLKNIGLKYFYPEGILFCPISAKNQLWGGGSKSPSPQNKKAQGGMWGN